MEFEKILKNWRIIFLVLCLAGALLLIAPRYGPDGWTTNLQRGFDLQGGARAVLQPTEKVDKATIQDAIAILQTRLNVYGLKDIKVFQASDLSGNSYIVVEAAGLTEEDVRQVVAKQGKFEAKIANTTIFTGADVGVDTYQSGVRSAQTGYEFSVALRVINPAAAQAFATETARLSTSFTDFTPGSSGYLNESLDLYLDDKLVDSLRISADLKGRVFDSPVVQGGAADRAEAIKKMEQMKAILQSGSLPIKLEISSLDRVSPTLGEVFVNNTLLAGLAAILAVGFVIFVRYREMKLTLLIMGAVLSEILLVLGLSVAIKWQLDLAAIAGIIVSVGTGVNQEIIMTDEFLFYGRTRKTLSFKEQIKNASFIIFAAFGSGIGVMLPLVFVGLGSVKGFAITTILGLVAGILVTRPAYLVFLDKVFSEKTEEVAPAAAPPVNTN
jgi:preprotein translocase subunit SecD